MSKAATAFVALVTDGRPIDGYGERCDKCGQPTHTADGRKDRYLDLGRSVMRDLAKRLDVDPKHVYVNRAGPAVSGDITLWTDDLTVSFSHRLPRPEWGDFFVRWGDARSSRSPTAWLRWEDLLDLPGAADKIRSIDQRGKPPSVAAEEKAEEEDDPFS